MNYFVLGAGAIGGTVGALLADAGEKVTLLARGGHADAIERDGLLLRRPDRELRLRLPVVRDAGALALGPQSVLLLATKTQHSAAMLERAAAADGAGKAAVVCLQNGVANEEIALRRFDAVVGACVMLPATQLVAGEVISEGWPRPGMFDLGWVPERPVDGRLDDIAAALGSAGFVAHTVDGVMPWKRAKLLRNLNNVLDALLGDSRRDDRVGELSRRVRSESEAVLRAAALSWTPDDVWNAQRGDEVGTAEVAGQPRSGSSSWQSLARGSTLETDYLNGEIALLARRAGIEAPLNVVLQRLAAIAVRDRLEPGSMSVDGLLAAMPS